MREKNLVLLRPPKRRILRDGIPLNETENARFWSFAKEIEIDGIIETFLSHSGLYLRGRCDGPHRSGTEPCGYVFISECSFDNGHAPLLYFDPFPRGRPLKISFRKWKGILPFSENDWSNLDGPDRLQRGMRVLKLDSMDKEERGVSLAIKARRTFSNVFDLSISLTEEQLQ